MKWLRAVIANRQLKTRTSHLEDQVRQLQSVLDALDLDVCDLNDRVRTLSGRKAKRKSRDDDKHDVAEPEITDINERIQRGLAV